MLQPHDIVGGDRVAYPAVEILHLSVALSSAAEKADFVYHKYHTVDIIMVIGFHCGGYGIAHRIAEFRNALSDPDELADVPYRGVGIDGLAGSADKIFIQPHRNESCGCDPVHGNKIPLGVGV